jgi:hypothetical protein
MPRNGAGSYQLPEAAFLPNTPISSSAVNSDLSDIGTALTGSVAADGQTTITGALKGSSGTASAPSYSFSSDLNTGMYRVAADTLGFAAGGTKIVEVTAAGISITGTFALSGGLTIASGGLTVTAGGITITAGTLTGTDATLSGLLTLSATDRMKIPSGTTAQRPGSPAAADFRYNSTLSLVEFYDGSAWRQPSIAQPIAAGFKNLVIQNNAVSPSTQVDVDADAVTVETTGGTAFRLTSINLTINCATTGANGLDAGALANSTWYAVYVIYNPTTDTTAGLMSASFSSPTMPSGYTAKARLGAFITSGSALFHGIRQAGDVAQYVVGLAQTSTAVQIATGSAGAVGTGPRDAIAVGPYAPPTAGQIRLFANTNNTAGAVTEVAPNASYAGNSTTTNPPPLMTTASSAQQSAFASFVLESTNIYWASNGGAVYCAGWQDNI